MKKVILDSILERIKPSKQELGGIKERTAGLKKKIEAGLRKSRAKAEVFIGGSLAKNTLIKKEKYDIDIFVRFQYKDYAGRDSQLSNILEKALKLQKLKYKKIHGSRDYFHFSAGGRKPVLFEIVPVLAIKKPQEARNVTDLSFFHVNYASKHINDKLADEIRLAKAFCYAQNCYGAESHIQGFSGYALELLVLHFGSLMNLARNAVKWQAMLKNRKKIVIDPAGHYKNADDVLSQINEAKLVSPIILVDPTYAIRNATASISAETLLKFIHACKKFIAKPGKKSFEQKNIGEEIIKNARKRKALLAIISAEAEKSKEEVAPAKLRRFFDFLVFLMQKNGFDVLGREIEFKRKEAKLYIVYKKPLSKMIAAGPPINRIVNLLKFKKKYKKVFVKDGKAFAKTGRKIGDIKKLLNFVRNGEEIKDMGIAKLRAIK